MVSETKLKEWSEAILKILQEGSDDKVVVEFAKLVDDKVSVFMR
jgi:hypothetical protein